LLELEHARTGERARETISTIFREAHSLKGAARAVDLPEIELICQSIESIFSAWRKQGTPPASEAFDPLLDAIALIERLLPGPDGLDAPAPRREELSTLLARLETFALTPPASTWQPAESDQAAPVQPSALSPAAHAASGAAPRQQQQRE